MPQGPITNWRIAATRHRGSGLEEVLDCLRTTKPELVRSWFQQLRLTSISAGLLEIMAPNAAQVRYLEAHCRPAFTEAAQATTGRLLSVTFTVLKGEQTKNNLTSPDRRAALDPAHTLDRFMTGPGNQLAHSTAVAVAERPGGAYNPFYVYGAAGLGKTHLLQGIVHAALGGKVQCLYVSCRTFVNDAIQAMEDGRRSELRERYGTVALLAVDDAHLLAGRERSEEEFFHVLNLLLGSQRQVVLAAERPPLELLGLQERLASRLSAGLVVALEAPCLETRMAIVRDKARLLAIDLPEKVVCLVATRFKRNIRQLAEALVRIDALSEFESSPITLDLATRAIAPGSPAFTGKNRVSP